MQTVKSILFGYPHRTYNDCDYYELLAMPSTTHLASAIINDTQKYVYPESLFSIDLITHSWKYDKELQFKSYSKEAPTLERRVDKEHFYYRLECGYLPVDLTTANKLEEIADLIRFILGVSMPRGNTTSKPRRAMEKVVDFI